MITKRWFHGRHLGIGWMMVGLFWVAGAYAGQNDAYYRGIVLPVRQSKLTFSQSGIIQQIAAVGARVARGEEIAHLEAGLVQVEQRKVEAMLDGARLILEQSRLNLAKNRRLIDQKVVSEVAVTEALLQQKQAEAGLRQMEAELAASRLKEKNCALVAPFDGVVMAVAMHPGEWASPGAPVVELADLAELELTIDVPPEKVDILHEGMESPIMIEGKTVGQAKMRVILPMVDPSSGLQRSVWQVVAVDHFMLAGKYVTLSRFRDGQIEDGAGK